MNKKIKIYIFSPFSFIGGDTLSLSRLIKNLSPKIYDISFICLKKTKITNYLKNKNFKIIKINSERALFSINKIRHIIKSDLKKNFSKYIFISNQNYANIISVLLLYKLEKIKLILIERNHIDEFKYQKNFKNLFIKLSIKYFYKRADEIIGISKTLSKDLSNHIKKKVTTIYNPSFDTQIYSLAKKPIKIKRKKNLILTVGRFENQKDPYTILKAFKLVLKKMDCNLIMIGFGSMFDKLNKFVKDNGIQKKVKILKNINNPFPYYKYAKLFILASKYEGFGNVIVEAAMFKVPIISSNCNSGPPEILLNGKGGDLFKVGNFLSLSEKILQNLKIKNKKKITYLFKSLKRFDIKSHVKKYEKIFSKI